MAQQATGGTVGLVRAPIVTLDQERLFSESAYGQRVLAELDDISRSLAERNRQVTSELTAEEKSLTDRRSELEPGAFRELADAFDAKVTQLRAEQDARIRQLQRKREEERLEFNTRVVSILTGIVRDAGAYAILDERAVIISAEQIDITDLAIQRIDAELGDGLTGTDAPQPSDADTAPAE